MLLTGFDAPRLKRLYLGRKLKDHSLLQALTRVNRPYKDIQFGYVVDFADIKQNFADINEAYTQELNKFDTGQSEEASVQRIMVSEDEVNDVMHDVQEVLFDYTTDNAEEFAQQMEEIDDHDHLIMIRHKLEEAKSVWNEVRAFGKEELKEKVRKMQPGDINNLLKVVSDRINNLNLVETFRHEAEVSSMINEALATIEFRFRKIGTDELTIEDNICEELNKKRRALANELSDNVDPEDKEYVSLIQEVRKYFEQKGFQPANLTEAKEGIGFMDAIMKRIKKINRLNAVLQKKYRGDTKFVRAHKRIMEKQKQTGKVLISESEVDTCFTLNWMKDQIDLLLTNNRSLILNMPYFHDEVKSDITKLLHSLKVPAKPADRNYLAALLTREYQQQYSRL